MRRIAGNNRGESSAGSVRVAAASHTGLLRTRNEDNYGATGLTSPSRDGEVVAAEISSAVWLAVVADGLGGHPRGDLASALVVEHIMASMPRDLESLMVSVSSSNDALFDRMRLDAGSVRMGSTVAAVVGNDSKLAVVNVGDSSVFEYVDNQLVELTASHVPVASTLPGLPSPNVSQALGGASVRRPAVPYVYEDDAQLPRRLLLCTDGLTNFVPRYELADVLGRHDGIEAISALIALALDAGGVDNVTAMIVDID